jgi:hypothetical protein|tara:strand:- start:749 stop:1273 length:525 start_codon:yes stop_codon:yes gene_type:complete
MAQLLLADTAATVTIGPFVDQTDFYTPEVGLTKGGVDELVLYKHDASAVTDISSSTTFTHVAGGMYTVLLSTTDTNTEGRLTLYVRDDSICVPIAKEFMVVQVMDFGNTATTAPTALATSTGTLRAKINWLFDYFFNKRTATSSTETHFSSAGSSLGTATITDDGTTVTRGKFS